jgi:hypothetical protein
MTVLTRLIARLFRANADWTAIRGGSGTLGDSSGGKQADP